MVIFCECVECYISVCEITACQRTFSGQKCFLSGHTDICMDKMSGQSLNQKLLEIDNCIHDYKSFSTMSRQFYPCPWKLCHALTVCLPIFQKLFRTLHICMHVHNYTLCILYICEKHQHLPPVLLSLHIDIVFHIQICPDKLLCCPVLKSSLHYHMLRAHYFTEWTGPDQIHALFYRPDHRLWCLWQQKRHTRLRWCGVCV